MSQTINACQDSRIGSAINKAKQGERRNFTQKTQYDGAASIQNEEYAGREMNEMASIKLWRSINFYYIKLY